KQLKDMQSGTGFGGFGPRPTGGGFGGPPQPGQIVPMFLRDRLSLTEEQKKQLDEFQKDVDGKLDKLLTEEQKKQLKEPPQGFGPGSFGGPPEPGQILSASVQERLKLSDEQKKHLEGFQKEVDGKLDKLLTEEQRKQLKERPNFAFGG